MVNLTSWRTPACVQSVILRMWKKTNLAAWTQCGLDAFTVAKNVVFRKFGPQNRIEDKSTLSSFQSYLAHWPCWASWFGWCRDAIEKERWIKHEVFGRNGRKSCEKSRTSSWVQAVFKIQTRPNWNFDLRGLWDYCILLNKKCRSVLKASTTVCAH